jgi:hypothetical protein
LIVGSVKESGENVDISSNKERERKEDEKVNDFVRKRSGKILFLSKIDFPVNCGQNVDKKENFILTRNGGMRV